MEVDILFQKEQSVENCTAEVYISRSGPFFQKEQSVEIRNQHLLGGGGGWIFA